MSIIIDSDRVNQIADELEKGNKNLKEQLEKTSRIMQDLGKDWDSTAYRESNVAFQKFEEEFSNSYEKIIASYVTFLREQVSKGYVEAEKANTDLASAFK